MVFLRLRLKDGVFHCFSFREIQRPKLLPFLGGVNVRDIFPKSVVIGKVEILYPAFRNIHKSSGGKSLYYGADKLYLAYNWITLNDRMDISAHVSSCIQARIYYQIISISGARSSTDTLQS